MKRKKIEELESDRVSILRDGKIEYLDMYPKLHVFQEAYQRCIDEYKFSFKAPELLAKDIVKKVYESIGHLVLAYPLESVIEGCSNCRKTRKALLNFRKNTFRLAVIYYDDRVALEDTLVRIGFSATTNNTVLEKYGSEASSFMVPEGQNGELGCTIAVNGTLVKRDDFINLAQSIDHELSQYFSSLKSEEGFFEKLKRIF